MNPDQYPVVLLHGLACDPYLWETTEGHLQRAGFEVHQPLMRNQDSISKMAAFVLEEVEGEFILGGLSMGGYVSFEIWRQVPERVKAMILCDTKHRLDTPERVKAREQTMRLVEKGKFDQMASLFHGMLTAPDYLIDVQKSEKLMGMIYRTSPEEYLRQQTAIFNRPDSTETLATIDCPTLILCGELDQITPPAVHQEMAGKILRAQLEIISGAGHLSTLEEGDKIGPLICNWLMGLAD
ncbi:MAG: alpha/beta hydrolase [Deltaproteobacteria bacterium]|jgi:pimeloyl-ACP methyl ester carboxylesterase|nr:alpha/beta hydrolase [Deltaproteobacteria bacterium]MBT6725618.1 alpha/beta hydrolase [Deltaproteobacteria bacterium]MBT7203437.1 alpha/beta hydrolase [Deltaproteobacteria bacterium]